MDQLTTFLAACLASRDACAVIGQADVVKDDVARILLTAITDYYERDPQAQWVDRAVLSGLLQAAASHPKAVAPLLKLLELVPMPAAVSAANVAAMVHANLVTTAKMRLQAALESGGDYQEQLQRLRELDRPAIVQMSTQMTAADLLRATAERTPIYPAKLNGVFAGGLAPGCVLIVFGRPGAGKTATVVNIAYGLLRRGKVVLHIMNEESQECLTNRYLSIMCQSQHGELQNLTHHDLARRTLSVEFAMNLARETDPAKLILVSSDAVPRGFNNLHIVHGVYSYAAVRELVLRLKPDMVIIDQIRHFGRGGEDALHQVLERVTQDLRAHAHEAQFIGVGVTQAGLSGEGKAVLGLADIDGAKTGLQGACDAIIGVGCAAGPDANQRVISVCRNKISGVITHFPVWLNEQHTHLQAPAE